MREFRRPRLWIALLFAVTAALFASLLPPQPNSTLKSATLVDVNKDTQPIIHVRAISNDGQFLIIGKAIPMGPGTETIAVWKNPANSNTALFSIDANLMHDQVFLSPDQTVLCYVDGIPEQFQERPDGMMGIAIKPRPITLFELSSGRKLKEYQSPAYNPFFGPDGRLLGVEKNVLRKIDGGGRKCDDWLPAKIDEFKYLQTIGEFALYARETPAPSDMRLYSWLTGELRSSATFSYAEFITQICADGRVLCWVERSWNNVGLREVYPSRIVDTSTGAQRKLPQGIFNKFARLSNDGEYLARLETMPALHKWLKWLPIRQESPCIRIERWRTNEEVALLPQVKAVCFSADGSRLAAVRDDNVIEIYDFPLRKPWGLIAGAAVLAAGGTWSLGWLWSRWRRKRQMDAPAIPAETTTADSA